MSKRLKKIYLTDEQQKELRIKYGTNHGLCPYIRSPGVVGHHYVEGCCSLNDFKPCCSHLPQNENSCEIYKKRFPSSFERD